MAKNKAKEYTHQLMAKYIKKNGNTDKKLDR
jgi:hypothetical protein